MVAMVEVVIKLKKSFGINKNKYLKFLLTISLVLKDFLKEKQIRDTFANKNKTTALEVFLFNLPLVYYTHKKENAQAGQVRANFTLSTFIMFTITVYF
jgi:hypothetical protein